jgi:hypothetical protein
MSEMSFARQLLKGDILEKARMKKAPNERFFGETEDVGYSPQWRASASWLSG